MQPRCDFHADAEFGPSVSPCRREFDFTVLFEDFILCIIPASLFILGAMARLFVLYGSASVAYYGRLYHLKLVFGVCLSALQIAYLAERLALGTARTGASIPSATMSAVASGVVCVVSHFEHRRSCRPSSLLILFLIVTILFDAARVRTLFLLHATAFAWTLSTSTGVRFLLLVAESWNKRTILLCEYQTKSAEELAGPINRTLFHWLVGLLLLGYRRVLDPADIRPIDHTLYSSHLSEKFSAVSTQIQKGFPRNGLAALTFRSLGRNAAYPVIPRLLVTVLTFIQPFLITSMLNHLDAVDQHPSHDGYGLIGAYGLVYLGIAAANSWYWHQTYRCVTMVRGGLSLTIFEKLLKLQENTELGSQTMTLEINDVQRIMMGFVYLHELWACVVETGLATWLLYGQTGVACFAMLCIAIISSFLCLGISRRSSVFQQRWLDAVQNRLSATSRMLVSLKSVKMLSANTRVAKTITGLRKAEMVAARSFRTLQVTTTFLSYSTLTLSPPLVFGVYFGISGSSQDFNVSKVFTSLTLMSILANSLLHVFQALPAFGAAHGCFKRIQRFLEDQERVDPRKRVAESADLRIGVDEKGPPRTVSHSRRGKVVISLQNVSLGWSDNTAILKQINLDIRAGSKVAVLGRIGCGKTLLLKGLLGEAEQLCGETTVSQSTAFAYCSQDPWLENVSAEQNLIQYGPESKESDTYQKLAVDCDLDDLRRLPDYSSGTIGSGGIRLSGGQRQRLALARTLSLQAEVVLLDDVFSGLDRRTRSHVAKSILNPAPSSLHSDRTIIYATHDRQIARLADEVYEIDGNGHISRQHDLKGSDEEELLERKNTQTADLQGQNKVPAVLAQQANKSILRDRVVYKTYLRSIGPVHSAAFLLLGILFSIAFKFPDIWVQWWSNTLSEGETQRNGYWLGVYATLQILPLIALTIWMFHLWLKVVPTSGIALHDHILTTVLGAPFPFITRVDSGSLMNRFNQDLLFIDAMLPFDIFNTASEFYIAIIQIFLIAVASVETLGAVPIILGVLYMIQHFYLRTSKQLRLLELETKADLHTKISDAAGGSGLSTIRAHAWQNIILGKFKEKLDRSQEPVYLLYAVQRWLQLVLNLTVAGLVVVVAAVAVALRTDARTGAMGVAFLNATTLGETLTQLVIAWTSLETSLGAIARIALFAKETPAEEPQLRGSASSRHTPPPPEWPEMGVVKFDNVWATYVHDAPVGDPHTQWTLRGIDLVVSAGEKIAICGGTGSGKSTMLLALLRMVHMPVGTISIDEIDHSHLPLSVLRGGFYVISQERLDLFESVRERLDPEGAFTDRQIFDVLKACDIQTTIVNSGGLDAGIMDCNLSTGEGQLLSVARTLLHGAFKRGGIVLMDEPTSSVDHESALKIDELIATRLRDKTVIAVSHRLETALKSDRIVVMNDGRMVDVGTPEEMLERCALFAGLSGVDSLDTGPASQRLD